MTILVAPTKGVARHARALIEERSMSDPACPVCGGKMVFMYGLRDYDRWVCLEREPGSTLFCRGEIELDTTTTPDELQEAR